MGLLTSVACRLPRDSDSFLKVNMVDALQVYKYVILDISLELIITL